MEAFPSCCWPHFWRTHQIICQKVYAHRSGRRQRRHLFVSNMKNEFRVNSVDRVGRWNRFRLMPLMDLHKSCSPYMHNNDLANWWMMRRRMNGGWEKRKFNRKWLDVDFHRPSIWNVIPYGYWCHTKSDSNKKMTPLSMACLVFGMYAIVLQMKSASRTP